MRHSRDRSQSQSFMPAAERRSGTEFEAAGFLQCLKRRRAAPPGVAAAAAGEGAGREGQIQASVLESCDDLFMSRLTSLRVAHDLFSSMAAERQDCLWR